MRPLARRVAQHLFVVDFYSQMKQVETVGRLYSECKPWMRQPPKLLYMQATRDPARLLAVFYDECGGLHFVYSDEVFPLSKSVDEQYRQIRCEKYGRNADVETIIIHPDGMVEFPTTCGPTNPYPIPYHHTCKTRFRGVIYQRTWNHLMYVARNPNIDYFQIRPRFLRGDREAAERFAEQHSACG